MDAIPAIVRKGCIELLHPIPAEDETPALVFVLPKTTEVIKEGDPFGKWDWFTDDMEQEVQGAWQRWTQKASSF